MAILKRDARIAIFLGLDDQLFTGNQGENAEISFAGLFDDILGQLVDIGMILEPRSDNVLIQGDVSLGI